MLNEAYLLDLTVGGSTQLLPFPANLEEDLLMAFCGKATKSDGSEVVVLAGGFLSGSDEALDDTWVYDVSQGVWLPGDPLPETRTWARAVQYQDTFIVVGGSDDGVTNTGNMRGQILKFDADGSAWEVMEQGLVNPDFVTVALFRPGAVVAARDTP